MLPTETVNLDAVNAGTPEILSAAVDLAVLASFGQIQIDGEPDLIVELIDLYREDAPRRVAVMRDSLATKNWSSVKREAHSLRGSSGTLGAIQLSLICDEIEGMDSGELSPNVDTLLSCLEQELERVLHIFLAERRRRLR